MSFRSLEHDKRNERRRERGSLHITFAHFPLLILPLQGLVRFVRWPSCVHILPTLCLLFPFYEFFSRVTVQSLFIFLLSTLLNLHSHLSLSLSSSFHFLPHDLSVKEMERERERKNEITFFKKWAINYKQKERRNLKMLSSGFLDTFSVS